MERHTEIVDVDTADEQAVDFHLSFPDGDVHVSFTEFGENLGLVVKAIRSLSDPGTLLQLVDAVDNRENY